MHVKDFDPYDFSKKDIDGVSVYYKNLPWAPCIHIMVSFKVGAFNDPIGKEGLAHFLEHMIGNGCPTLPDKKAMKEFSRLYMLNTRNAFTGYHRTAYHGKCLPENFIKVMMTMRDYVFNPFLRPEDAEHERKVITQEAWGRYKNEKYLKYIKETSDNVYHGHERSRISYPLGWPETVAIISQQDIKDFHKRNYVRENMSIFLVGAINESDLATLSDFMKGVPSGKKVEINSGKVSKPKVSRFEKNSADIGNPQEQVSYSISRTMDRVDDKENGVIIQTRMLMYDILFERLRIENSLCYGVSLHFGRYADYTDIEISVDTGEDKIKIVEKEMWSVINEIIEGKWKERFSIIHKLSLDQLRSNELSSDAVINDSASIFVIDNRIVTLKELLTDVENVKYEDVKNMVKRVFNPEYVFTEVILPSKKV